MKTEILRLLREEAGYISGQQLCNQFQVSRTAVWKAMEQLKKEGYRIEAVRNKGYRLIDSPDILSGAELESRIKTRWAGQKIVYYDRTDSTNIQAKIQGEQGAPHGTLVAADCQAEGKGRRGRSWDSPAGDCVYMTILLRPELSPSRAPMLTLVMALSAAEAIREKSGLDAGIKWPNDLVVNRKKVCGILTEMSAEIDYINYVVIGVGINMKQKAFPEALAETATSLQREGGRLICRAELIAEIMRRFEENYEVFLAAGDLSPLLERYNRLLVNRGQNVRVLDPGGAYSALASAINEKGELLVTTPEGEEKHIYAGEVSVRGIYGYV